MIALKLLSMLLLAYVYYTEAIPHRFVETEETAESFSRYSVEHIPTDDAQKMNLRMPNYNDIEGIEEQQFSRAAVESVPKTIVSDYRPLRLAVEYNPRDDSFSRSHSRQERFLDIVLPDHQRKSRAYNLQAYVVPIYNPYGPDPLYYRTGSPYQQLVDIRTFDQLTTQPEYSAFGNIKMIGSEKNQLEERFKVICHLTNWAFYRKEEGRFAPENLDYGLCTHVLYSFATLDPIQFIIKEFDTWVDIENNLYIRTVNAAAGIPVYLAIGGWTDSTIGKYSTLVADSKLREKFIENAVPFLKRFGFSGLHIDWNYPTCPQSDCKNGDEKDRDYFTEFIAELNYRLKQSDLKVSISVSGYKEIIEQGYDFVELSKNIEFMTVMTYDYHGAWENITGHTSPLYASSTDRYPQYNTDYAITLLREKGADMEKVIMGIPCYAQSFTLGSRKKSLRGYNAPAIGPGEPGEITNQPGMLGYNEICNLLRRPNFKKGVDPNGNSGPYITDGSIWAGFDDSAFILKKTQYIKDKGLGGASAWTVDLDDFNNNCCLEPFPLLRAINRGLGRLNSPTPTVHSCEKPAVVTPPPAIMSVTEDSGQAGIPMSASDESQPQSTSPWWTQSTTTRRPAIQSTSRKPSQSGQSSDSTPIPAPVNVMPVYVPDETCDNGEYKRHPTSCSMYLVCVGNVYQEQPCPQKLHWNDAHKHCDWPESANCQIVPASDEVVTTPSTTSKMPEKPLSTTTSRRPRPTKTQAMTTVTEQTTKMTEATTTATRSTTRGTRPSRRPTRKPTTVRDPIETQRPTYAEITTTIYTTTTIPETTTIPTTSTTRRRRRTTTTSTMSTTESTTTSTTTNKPQKKPTKCVNGEYYPSKDCSQFFICSNNRRVKQKCPEGLQYSQKIKQCDYEENVKCVSRKKYMKLLQMQYKNQGIFTASLLKASTGDPCEGQSFLAYPGDCSKYLICNHDQLLEMPCPAGLSFNPANSNCDWPQNVDCISDPSLNEEESEYEDEEDEENTENEVIDESSKPQSSVKPPASSAKPTTTSMKPSKPAKPTKPSKPVEPSKPSKPAKPSRDPVTSLQTIPVKEHVEPLTGKFKLVCYFTNWAWYRPGEGKYLPDDIDENLCTHIVYGFAVLNYDELTMRTHDSWADIDNRFYERVVEYKKKGIKVTLAIGGWNDSAGDKYSRLVRNSAARAKFIKHAVEFLEKYGFDGLDLDWEYPVCWQVDCKKGYADEKKAFASLVKELSAAFKPKGLLLSAAVSPSKTVIDAGYDVPELSKYMDWIAVMCYDYHGQWDKKTGHLAPFYHHPEDDVDYFNVDYTIKYWIDKGALRDKIILGLPLYGQAFTLADSNNNGLNAKAPGPGTAGEFTRAAGFLAYYEICDRIFNRDWKVVQDSKGRMGPYAYNGNQWVSFDDQAILQKKSQYIIDMGLGGGMVWALDLDDFRGKCGQGKHPLLKIIHQTLQDGTQNEVIGEDEYDEEDEEDEEIEQKPISEEDKPVVEEGEEEYVDVKPIEQKPVTQKPVTHTHKPQTVTQKPQTVTQKPQVVTQKPTEKPDENEIDEEEDIDDIDDEETEGVEEEDEDYEDEEDNEIDEYEGKYKVVCYFTNWAWYRPGIGKFKPEDIDYKLCTHIVYGFAVLNRDSLTIQPHDSWADIDNKFYERVVEYKKKGIKVTIAIGGWNDSAGDKYSRLVRDAAARARFIKNVIEFIEKYGFDGLDLDWEYPVCWQVECEKGHPDEKENFAAFVEELSTAFKPKRLLLSSAVSPSKRVIDAGYDVKKLSKNFDWIAVMAYDYHGQWDKKTGHVAPMYVHPDDSDKTFNSNFTLNYWIHQGADPRKLVFGMPMYGQSFSLADRIRNTLNSPTYGGGEAGEETRARGFLSYYEICDRIKNQKWTVVKDPRGSMGPYAYKGDQWVSFDDNNMIRHKSEYVKALGLGGAMIWALDLDDFKNSCGCEEYPLLRTINRVLRDYPGPHNNCNLESRIKPPKPDAEETTKAPTTAVTTTMTTAVTEPYKPTKKKTTSRPKPTSTTVKSTTYEGEDYEEEDEDDEEGTNLNDNDSCVDGTYFAHETDCSKYYICNFASKLEQSCMYGLQWNQKTMNCDWPSNVQCISKDEEHEIEKEDEEDEDNDIDSGHETLSSPKPSKKPVTQKPTTTTTMATTTRKPKPTRPPVETNPFIPTGNNDFMVVCYFTNWAWYRPGIGKYKPSDIDPTLCTHIVYGFAVLNSQTLQIRTHDSWADIDNNFYTKVTEFRKLGIKVSVAIGGWNDSLGDKYSRLVRDPEARRKFIKNVIEFMKKYDFEGLDLDWEYPVCWQVDCTKGKPEEKQAFTAFVRELKEAFEPEGFLLSAAVSPAKKVIDAGYEISELTKYFDWIAVMCYDYHGQWDKKTGHVSPLYHHPESTEATFNANYTMHYWIEKGADRKKLVMGMSMYGQSFTLEISSSKNTPGLNTKAPAGGQAGEFTRSAGFLAFYEICHKVNTGGWTVVKDPTGAIGSYAYKDRQWVSYDDVEQVRRKTQYVKDLGIGGAMIWALDLDDFRNRCGCGAHPLLSTINLELGRINTPRLNDCT
ncbi:unnamed protein product [Chironomus riparius]|uniref:chitinase n=1 Tax=Chironomus riparius TaxID=315576 RepID=A0A9N9WSC7_9DIPT|nr:unnamed protein product [Chironomus riparius]